MSPQLKQYVQFDVMADGYYQCTLRYPHCPLFRLDPKELLDYAYRKRPTLKYRKNIQIYID